MFQAMLEKAPDDQAMWFYCPENLTMGAVHVLRGGTASKWSLYSPIQPGEADALRTKMEARYRAEGRDLLPLSRRSAVN